MGVICVLIVSTLVCLFGLMLILGAKDTEFTSIWTQDHVEEIRIGFDPELPCCAGTFRVGRGAAQWKIDPERIGMVGFSAGAMLTMATALVGENAKPAFIGNIYGPLASVTVPADAPPLFVALAADDPFFGRGGYGLIDSWRAAGRPVEFHLYEQGGHGFGMYPKETTSTGWFDAFVSWLAMHGMADPRA